MQSLRNYLISFGIGLVVFLILGTIIKGWLTDGSSTANSKKDNGKVSTVHSQKATEIPDILSGKTFTAIIGGFDDSGKELDALIFIKADKENKQFVMSSIPTSFYTRIKSTDSTTGEESTTYIRIKDYPTRFAYNEDGLKNRICDIVHSITGMKVDYYVFLNSTTIEKLFKKTKALHYDVPYDIVYIGNGTEENPEFKIEAGSQTFTWEKALNYMRFAYDSETDEKTNAKKRAERQIAFLESAIKQVLKNNPAELIEGIGEILDTCETNFTVDDFRENAELIAMFNKYQTNVVTIYTDPIDYSVTQKLFEVYK